MTSETITKKRRFKPLKFLKKLTRRTEKNDDLQNLSTIDTSPSESYVRLSPRDLHNTMETQEREHYHPDMDQGDENTSLLDADEGPFDESDDEQDLEINKVPTEDEANSIASGGTDTKIAKADRQLAKVNVLDNFINSCISGSPQNATNSPPRGWFNDSIGPQVPIRRRTFMPPSIEGATTDSVKDASSCRSEVKSDVISTISSEANNLVATPAAQRDLTTHEHATSHSVMAPLRLQRSNTAPSMSRTSTLPRSTPFVFHNGRTSNASKPDKTLPRMVDDSAKPVEITQALPNEKPFPTVDLEEGHSPEYQHTTTRTSSKVRSTPRKASTTGDIVKSHEGQSASSGQRRLTTSHPLPTRSPRRSIDATPRKASLTADKLYAMTALAPSQDDVEYDDDEDTTFDMEDDESTVSYLGASESGYYTEDTGSVSAPPSEYTASSSFYSFDTEMNSMGGLPTEDETDNDDQTDDYLSDVYESNGEDDDDDVEVSMLQHIGGELMDMATELQKGGSQVLLSWLDLR